MGDVFGRVMVNYERRTIELFCLLDHNSYPDVRRALIDMGKDGKPIWLLIDSPGGDLFAGNQTFALLRACASPVIGLVMGQASSAAALALQGCNLRIALSDLSVIGLHEPTGWVGSFEAKSERFAAENKQAINAILHAFVWRDPNEDREEEIKEMISGKISLYAKEAMEKGIVDAILIDRENILTSLGKIPLSDLLIELSGLELPF